MVEWNGGVEYWTGLLERRGHVERMLKRALVLALESLVEHRCLFFYQWFVCALIHDG